MDGENKKAKRSRKTLRYFIITLVIGLQLAFLVSYLYLMYKDLIKAEGEIPDTITYQGKIINDDGVPPPDGLYNMVFRIYDASTGGNLLWQEYWDNTNHGVQGSAQKVQVNSGVFSIELNSLCQNWVGACASNGGVTFSTSSFYLQVELDYDGDATFEEIFTPRKRFTAIPFSMNTDKIDGKDSTDFILKAGDSMTGDLTVPQVVTGKVSDSSLTALYQFNGDEKDSSQNALDGVIQNGAVVLNGVLELAGTASQQYVSVSDDDLLSFGIGTEDSGLSVSTRLNLTDATDFNFLTKGIFNSNAEYRLFVNNNDKLEVRLYDESVADCYIGRLYDTAVTDLEGNWINVVVTYDGSGTSAGVKLYLNGNLLTTVASELNASSYVAMENLNANLYIGRYDTAYANGKLDDLAIYKRELTADEVKRLYSSGEKNNIQSNNLTSKGINLFSLDDDDKNDINEIEGGNLVWDAAYNRFKFDAEVYAPNIIPYFNNSVQDRDYTYIADPNKVLAYDFHESAGISVPDLEVHANATINGNADWTNTGYIGYGMKFDDEEDYLEISTDLRNVLSSTQGSVEMWARLNDIISSNDSYLARLSEVTTNEIAIYKNYVDLSNLADLYITVGDSGEVDTGWNFPDNSWHHFILTWNGGDVGVYVDGASVYTEEDAYTTLDVSTFTSLYLGAQATTGINCLNGVLDSVAMYDDVLTATEIANHYNAAFHNLYVSNLLSDGTVNTTLANLNEFPAIQNELNKIDPVYNNQSKNLAFSFAEGSGSKVFSANTETLFATVNGASWSRNGYYGYGMNFDGVDDYLVVADADDAGGDLDLGTGNFTIDFWLKGFDDKQGGADNASKRIISKRDGNTGYEVYLDSGDRPVFFLGDGTDTYTSTGQFVDVSDGNWHHVVLSFDMANDSVYYNIEGWLGQTYDIASANIDSLDNTADLYIAKDATGNFYKGDLDSVVIRKDILYNLYDAYSTILQGPEMLFVNSRTVSANQAPFYSFNQSNDGLGAFVGLTNPANTAGFPLYVANEASTSDVYNMLLFGTTTTPFGYLAWDNANTKFILSQSLQVQGDLQSNFLGTDSNELLAYDVIRHTITSGEASGATITESWSKTTVAKIANLHAVNSTGSLASADNWTSGGSYVDLAPSYDGSTITVLLQNGAWAEGNVVSIFVVYEK